MHSSDITDTCPPFLHLTVTPAGSQFESGHAVACVNALLRLTPVVQPEGSVLPTGTDSHGGSCIATLCLI